MVKKAKTIGFVSAVQNWILEYVRSPRMVVDREEGVSDWTERRQDRFGSNLFRIPIVL